MKTGFCNDCFFWEEFWRANESPYAARGICRRYAPRPIIKSKISDDGELNVEWPITDDVDFCGEHRPSIRQAEKK